MDAGGEGQGFLAVHLHLQAAQAQLGHEAATNNHGDTPPDAEQQVNAGGAGPGEAQLSFPTCSLPSALQQPR